MTVSRLLPAFIVPLVLSVLSGCGTTQQGRSVGTFPPHGTRPVTHAPVHPELPKAGSGRGGYYQDDGPGDAPPANLQDVPDAVVRAEPYSRYANRPYVVFGKKYTPMLDEQPFVQRGLSSWYGKKFHGQKTSSGELYDMYKMTAAHPTLPIPSYARITINDTGKQVVVRIRFV
jgi:rare lipoprotein A